MTTAITIPGLDGYTFLVECGWDECGRTFSVQSATGPDGLPVAEAALNDLVDEWDDALGEVAEASQDRLEAILDTPCFDPVDPAWQAEMERQTTEGERMAAEMLRMTLAHPEWMEPDDF